VIRPAAHRRSRVRYHVGNITAAKTRQRRIDKAVACSAPASKGNDGPAHRGRSARSSASCSDAYKAAVAVSGAGYGRQPIDNAAATPVRPPWTGGLRGQAHQADKRINENLT
jgi:hypothetical protein